VDSATIVVVPKKKNLHIHYNRFYILQLNHVGHPPQPLQIQILKTVWTIWFQKRGRRHY